MPKELEDTIAVSIVSFVMLFQLEGVAGARNTHLRVDASAPEEFLFTSCRKS